MHRRLRSAAAAAVAACCCWAGNPPQAVAAVDPGFLHTSGRQIVDAAGRSVRLAGVNWSGSESWRNAPQGLDRRDYRSMLDQMVAEGFNTLRLPYAGQTLASGAQTAGIDFSIGANAELRGLSPVEVMDKIVAYAGKIGMKVILDHHGPASSSGLWYTQDFNEARWISDWKMLAARYRNQDAVVGADLHNEPHGDATWGDGNQATDWRLAAERAGNAILGVNPNWLIVVEGIEHGPTGNYWWGGNLQTAGASPVRLGLPDRLVYSPHDYPADVYSQWWFSDPTYPSNLPGIWDRNWGYLFRQGVAPLLLGEFGTKLDDQSDRQWLTALTNYLGTTSDRGADTVSWAFWDWGPAATDTGGVLTGDWTTVDQGKEALLAPIKFTLPGAPPPSPGGAQGAAAAPADAPAAVNGPPGAPTATPGSNPTPRPAAPGSTARLPTRARISAARFGARTLRVAGTCSVPGTGRILVQFTAGARGSRVSLRRTITARTSWATTFDLGSRRLPAAGRLEVTCPGDATHLPAAVTRTVRR